MKTITASLFYFPRSEHNPITTGPLENVLKSLGVFTFTSIDRSPDGGPCTIEASDGWTDAEDFLLDPADISRGHYLTFGLRLDRRKVPARTLLKVFRAKFDEWAEKERGASGQQPELPGTGAGTRFMNPNPKPSRAGSSENHVDLTGIGPSGGCKPTVDRQVP